MSRIDDARTERCQLCGQAYSYVWSAPNWFWNSVMGHEGGMLCIPCFSAICERNSVMLYWTCNPLWLEKTERQVLDKMQHSGWKAGRVRCVACKHIQISVWPVEADGNTLQCRKCGRMSCAPYEVIEEDEP